MAREQLIEVYMDYYNNYLLIKTWGADNGLSEDDAEVIINLGRKLARVHHLGMVGSK